MALRSRFVGPDRSVFFGHGVFFPTFAIFYPFALSMQQLSPTIRSKDRAMAQDNSAVQEVIDTLRRQRVRQGDFKPVLECIIVQASVLKNLSQTGFLAETAAQMTAQAQELQRIIHSVPKFVVEDLLDEAISCLERAHAEDSSTLS